LFVSIIKDEKKGKIFLLTFLVCMLALRDYVETELQQRNCHVERDLQSLWYPNTSPAPVNDQVQIFE